jgi:hypothetical protein
MNSVVDRNETNRQVDQQEELEISEKNMDAIFQKYKRLLWKLANRDYIYIKSGSSVERIDINGIDADFGDPENRFSMLVPVLINCVRKWNPHHARRAKFSTLVWCACQKELMRQCQRLYFEKRKANLNTHHIQSLEFDELFYNVRNPDSEGEQVGNFAMLQVQRDANSRLVTHPSVTSLEAKDEVEKLRDCLSHIDKVILEGRLHNLSMKTIKQTIHQVFKQKRSIAYISHRWTHVIRPFAKWFVSRPSDSILKNCKSSVYNNYRTMVLTELQKQLLSQHGIPDGVDVNGQPLYKRVTTKTGGLTVGHLYINCLGTTVVKVLGVDNKKNEIKLKDMVTGSIFSLNNCDLQADDSHQLTVEPASSRIHDGCYEFHAVKDQRALDKFVHEIRVASKWEAAFAKKTESRKMKQKLHDMIGGDDEMARRRRRGKAQIDTKEVNAMGKLEEMQKLREQVSSIAQSLGLKEIKKKSYAKFQVENSKGKQVTVAILESRKLRADGSTASSLGKKVPKTSALCYRVPLTADNMSKMSTILSESLALRKS